MFDSRSGPKVGAGQVVTFQVIGLGGVPAGTPSVALNLTIDRPDAAGFASVFASGTPVPETSNVNFGAGQTKPNVVFAPVGADGKVSVYVSTGAHVIADVLGWYSTASDAQLFKPVKPKRVWDSRQHTIIPAGGVLTLKVTDIVGVPSTATAVVLNVTVTGPDGDRLPHGVPGQRGAARSVERQLRRRPDGPERGDLRRVRRRAHQHLRLREAHIIVDVAGWFG